MANDNNNKNPNEKQPGENPEGKYHFNPGDLSPSAHPAMGRVLTSFEPVRLGDATGWGAEPSV
jgi:hypothetical protein